jgi:hypothetical protein
MIYDQRARISQVEEDIELLPFYFSSAKSMKDFERCKAKSMRILDEIKSIIKAVNDGIRAEKTRKEG